MTISTQSKPNPIKIWMAAIRPATLTASIVPVAVGGSLAWSHGHQQIDALFAALLGALFIQIATNLHNDYEDFVRGADTEERLGQARVTQKGWMTGRTVLMGAILAVLVAIGCAAYLTVIAGYPIVLIAIFSLISGFAYTGGPKPLGYMGLGDVFVFLFFGVVAVCGTYYAMSLTFHLTILLASIPVGLLASAILVVNNLRDRVTDIKVGKRTVVVRFGEKFGRNQYLFFVLFSYLVPLLAWQTEYATKGWMMTWISLPIALLLCKKLRHVDGRELNPYLGKTAILGVIYAFLFSIGVLL